MNSGRGHLRLIIISALVAVGLILAACGAQPAPPPPAPEEPAAVEPAAPAEPEVVIITATSPPAAEEPAAEEPAEPAPAEPTAEPEPPAAEEPAAPAGDTGPVTANSDWSPQAQSFEGTSMLLVPTGCFQLGGVGAAATLAERPEHPQCVDAPFWIAETEVTNGQAKASGFTFATAGEYAADNFPRDNVTWVEAKAFCESLGMRLPTEVEWEWAASGPDNLAWPSGDVFQGGFIIWAGNASLAAAVGQFSQTASWVGAFDMAGNVREWTSTGQASYPYDASDGRENYTESGTQLKITRGGSYSSGGDFTRTSYRDWYDRDNFTGDIGWRCVRDF